MAKPDRSSKFTWDKNDINRVREQVTLTQTDEQALDRAWAKVRKNKDKKKK